MKKLFVAIALFATVLSASAGEEQWITVGGHKGDGQNFVFSALRQSGKFVTTGNGGSAYAATFRVVDNMVGKTTYGQAYVLLTECAAGQGTLVDTDMTGNFLNSTAFVRAGGTVGDAQANALCQAAEATFQQKKNLSIPNT